MILFNFLYLKLKNYLKIHTDVMINFLENRRKIGTADYETYKRTNNSRKKREIRMRHPK